jgi:GH25 family lysozyme M1 (1,4-beta-N-acetylmuramidase)
MKRKIHKRLMGMVTALVLGACSLPAGLSSTIAQAETLEEMFTKTSNSDFVQLAYLTLCSYASDSVGGNDVLSLTNQILLDVDGSGQLDSDDAYLLLSWYATSSVSGTLPEEAQNFLGRWELAVATETQTSTTTATTIATTTEAATTATTVPETEAPETATVASETVGAASETTTTTTTTTTTAATTTVTTTTVATTATTTTTTTQNASASYYDGIDVSKWQGSVNWTSVKNSGIDFAIIRAGYGRYISQKDPYFEQNYQNAKAAGLQCGAYWFSYATTPDEAVQEAEVFAQVVEGKTFEYPLVFDIENSTQAALSKEQVSAIITAFCSTMEEKGYYVSLYSYANFLNTKVYDSVLQKYDIWVAHFGVSSPSYTKTSYGMWQYSSTGTVSGVSGSVDMDYSYRNYAKIMASAGLNGY